ncbi:acetyl/propionyl/methylcrotonyl-CoA carboxylase subunit alpha [Aeromicrobium wangtongii]|uniref:ATP-grasp domain-containing protein n=1 Tax=Aeromicrobium wangtongii TaxID=2969247 RepID=A0ABY5MAM6_9ACTN|nr:biotin carboxylase N-terminal domain-containing protein [Aeromicrobium wangtongii]MCD9199442.1 ATP-grasp domain-containing protein [Aeromicrobium wangtongii]UUP13797.1 ATP-grasp domain-containing protein [Aeromicrobium wangtongii]
MTFSSVLIANRGEIARRVILACRAAGLRSIAVYSDADADAPYVQLADDAVHLGPTPATESYLSIDRLLAAAAASGAEAIHPGYGFLSERAEFARAVVEAGLVFIGPTAEVMDAMGRKDRARAIAEKAGVPVMPQFAAGDVPADAYPVLVKAAAGGGGKGMRIVREASELAAAIEAAGREAASAFGDDTLLVEKYVEAGRHVEVQVFGDEAGHVVHLFERDCSVQRRHQKVVEEAPAYGLTDELRRTLHDSSVALCREVGYTGAGTVEFLVADGRAYFLEMNTRLQVEHPVTEEITGLDLVQWQLNVAAGEPLPLTQDEITATGHAMEVRVYAEDPYAGFLPQAGHVLDVAWAQDARIESDLAADAEVSTAYDPMLGKLVVSGSDREDARQRLVAALDDSAVFGVTTNLGFARRLVASEEFAAGQIHTAWLDSPASAELLTAPAVPEEAVRTAAAVWARYAVVGSDDPFGRLDGWRSGADPAPTRIALEDQTGRLWSFGLSDDEIDDVEALAIIDRDSITIAWHGQTWPLETPDPMRGGHRSSAATDADLVSPMPGTVLRVDVAVGDTVVLGQQLGVVEAMKMELAMTAPYDGVVADVGAAAGDQVPIKHLLFTVDPA